MKRRDFLKVSSGGLGLAMLPNISLGNVDPEVNKLYYEMLGNMYRNNIIPHNITKIQTVAYSIHIYCEDSRGMFACGRFCDTITENMSKEVKRLLYNHIEYLKNTYTKKDFELSYLFVTDTLNKIKEANIDYNKITPLKIYNDINLYRHERFGWYCWIEYKNKDGLTMNSLDCEMDYLKPGITHQKFSSNEEKFNEYQKICQPVIDLSKKIFKHHTGIKC